MRKKALKFALLHNYFPGLFTEAQIWHCKPYKFGIGRFLKEKVNSSQNMIIKALKLLNFLTII